MKLTRTKFGLIIGASAAVHSAEAKSTSHAQLQLVGYEKGVAGGYGPTHGPMERAWFGLKPKTHGSQRRWPRLPPPDMEANASLADRREMLHVLNDDGGLATNIDTAEEVPTLIARLGLAIWGILFVALAAAFVLVPLPGFVVNTLENKQASLSLVASFVGIMATHWASCCLQDYIIRSRYNGQAFPSIAFLFWFGWVLQLLTSSAYLWFNRQPWPSLKAFAWSIVPVATDVFTLFNWHGFLYYATIPASVAFANAQIVPTVLLMALVNKSTQCASGTEEHAGANTFWRDFGLGLLATGLLVCLMGSIVCRIEQFSLQNSFMSALYYLDYVIFGAIGPVCQRLMLDYLPGVGISQLMLTLALASAFASSMVVTTDTGFSIILGYLWQSPEASIHVLMVGMSHVASHFFDLYVISRHGPVTLAAMMVAKETLDLMLPAYLLGLPLGSVLPHIFGAGLLVCLYVARVTGALHGPDAAAHYAGKAAQTV